MFAYGAGVFVNVLPPVQQVSFCCGCSLKNIRSLFGVTKLLCELASCRCGKA